LQPAGAAPVALPLCYAHSVFQACAALAVAVYDYEKSEFLKYLHNALDESSRSLFTDLLSDFNGWCGGNKSKISPALLSALDNRKRLTEERRQIHRRLVSTLWLSPDPGRKSRYLEGMQVIAVQPLTQPYPPLGYWIYESEEIYQLWGSWLTAEKQPDKRLPRRPLMHLDFQQLAYDVGPTESIIFRDKGELELAIFRNFCEDTETLAFVDRVILESVGVKKSIRVS
jgi:hypothetical protein